MKNYLLLRNKELPQHLSCPSAIIAIRSPRKSASSLKSKWLTRKETEHPTFRVRDKRQVSGVLRAIKSKVSDYVASKFAWYTIYPIYMRTQIKCGSVNTKCFLCKIGRACIFHYWRKFACSLHEMSCQNNGLSCFVLQKEVPCSSSCIWIHSRSGLIQEHCLWSSNESYSTTAKEIIMIVW